MRTEISETKYRMIVATLWIIAIVIVVGIGYGIYLVGSYIDYNTERYEGQIEDIQNSPIITLSDGSVTQGGFFLGIGLIGENPYFYYYEGTARFTLERVPADRTAIIMDEDQSPYVSKISYVDVYRSKAGTMHTGRTWIQPRYEFHVPKGTITKKFNLDGVM